MKTSEGARVLRRLQRFVDKNKLAGSKTASAILAPLVPLIEETGGGLLHFDGSHCINRKSGELVNVSRLELQLINALKWAITTEDLRRASKISFASIQPRYPRPDWMSVEVYQRQPTEAIQASIVDAPEEYFNGHLNDELWHMLFETEVVYIINFVRTQYLGEIGARGTFLNFLHEVICVYLCLEMEGRHQEAERFDRLFRLLPSVIPMGEIPHQPGHWLVLTA